jgi:hypothetical protein
MTSIDTSIAPPAVEDDLEAELIPLRRARRLPVVTVLLALAAVAGAAFLGGVELQKHRGGGGSRAVLGAGGAAAGAGRRAGRFGGAGAAAGFATGSVTLIKGDTIYVTDASGNTVEVATAGATVSKTVTATAKSISPGDTVVVRGSQGANGTLQASEITLGGAGGGSGGGGFGGGATGFGGGSDG